jgi:putative pyruvate formate lyase activating enzyme
VDRSAGEEGYCGIGRCARVASSGPHFGEEDCLRGSRGSGTIFFAGCNLHCVFCQNWDISQRHTGRKVDAEGIAELMLDLQRAGCHNINLVTPEHVVPHVVEALAAAIESGVRLPVVYNTSAYDAIASLKLLDGLIDIYMPDFKFWSSQSSLEYVDAEDYADRARDAIREMHRQVGDLVFTPDGVACRGVLVRHLVMPGMLAETAAIFRWLADEVSPDTHVNIMAQYHPDNEVGRDEHEAIDRRPTAAEMKAAYGAATDAGLWRFDERWA